MANKHLFRHSVPRAANEQQRRQGDKTSAGRAKEPGKREYGRETFTAVAKDRRTILPGPRPVSWKKTDGLTRNAMTHALPELDGWALTDGQHPASTAAYGRRAKSFSVAMGDVVRQKSLRASVPVDSARPYEAC
jgi:hypothetical protein